MAKTSRAVQGLFSNDSDEEDEDLKLQKEQQESKRKRRERKLATKVERFDEDGMDDLT
jgi:hypothetical protein